MFSLAYRILFVFSRTCAYVCLCVCVFVYTCVYECIRVCVAPNNPTTKELKKTRTTTHRGKTKRNQTTSEMPHAQTQTSLNFGHTRDVQHIVRQTTHDPTPSFHKSEKLPLPLTMPYTMQAHSPRATRKKTKRQKFSITFHHEASHTAEVKIATQTLVLASNLMPSTLLPRLGPHSARQETVSGRNQHQINQNTHVSYPRPIPLPLPLKFYV